MPTPPLRTLEFFISGEPGALITVTETAAGKLHFKVRVTDMIASASDKTDIADLRGLFFKVSNDSLLPSLTIEGPDVNGTAIGAGSVIKVNNDVTMSGAVKNNDGFDVGIEFGTQGIGKDDIRETTFTLGASEALKLEFVLNQAFGFRMTSVSENGSGRELSLKETGSMTGTPKAITPPEDPGTDPGGEDPDDEDPGTEDPDGEDPGTDEPGTDSNAPIPDVSYDDLIEAGDHNDTIYGGLGNDEMQGEGGDDLIIGGKDNGRLDWANGLSVAIGDNLYGNSGNDTFLYKKGDGVDLIWDFQPGLDVIKITGYTLADVDAFTHVRSVSNRIHTGSHDKIAIILDGGVDAIVFNDYPHPSNNDVAIVFADGTTLTSARIKELAEANHSETGSKTFDTSPVRTGFSSVKGWFAPLDLYGGNEGDTLLGGLGDDRLYGNEGFNGLNGRAGNDQLYGGNVKDILLGQEGDDIGYGNGGDDTIVGGAGSDKLYGTGGADLIYGDDAEGLDLPTILTTYTPAPPGQEVSGSVRITNTWWGGFQGEITVTANESVNSWRLLLKSKFNVDSIWGAEPVGEASWHSGVVYNLGNASWNASLAAGQTTTIGFTARTGVNNVVDAKHLIAGLSIEKQVSTAALPGESLVNALGNTLRGYAGADVLLGTGGDDTYYVDDAGDQVIEAAGGGAADSVLASVSHNLAANVERVSAATGTVGINLAGNTLNNVIEGNATANKLAGGAGADVLAGGAGADIFVFNTKLAKTNVDRIADFNVKDDTLHLENAYFKKVGKAGKLNKKFFTLGDKAKDKDDHVIYNKKTGVLFYDADGEGAGKAVSFTKLAKNLKMSAADFFVT